MLKQRWLWFKMSRRCIRLQFLQFRSCSKQMQTDDSVNFSRSNTVGNKYLRESRPNSSSVMLEYLAGFRSSAWHTWPRALQIRETRRFIKVDFHMCFDEFHICSTLAGISLVASSSRRSWTLWYRLLSSSVALWRIWFRNRTSIDHRTDIASMRWKRSRNVFCKSWNFFCRFWFFSFSSPTSVLWSLLREFISSWSPSISSWSPSISLACRSILASKDRFAFFNPLTTSKSPSSATDISESFTRLSVLLLSTELLSFCAIWLQSVSASILRMEGWYDICETAVPSVTAATTGVIEKLRILS